MKKNIAWLPIERVEALVQLEPLFVVLGLSIIAVIIYKFFLHAASIERHRNLRNLFKNLLFHLLGTCTFYAFFEVLRIANERLPADVEVHGAALIFQRFMPYMGVVVILWGTVAFVKVCRILFFEYLFLGHMREGVPLLLVNLFTFLLSLILAVWTLTEVFNIQLTAFLATSAIASIVLGLALQETLGNLFAAVALQFDKPYELGDWIEIQNGGQKWVGKVKEISWRSTVLIGILDEVISVPNRVIAQSQISNFSGREQPFVRTHNFRIPFGADIDRIKSKMIQSTAQTPGVLKRMAPMVLVFDTTESWVSARLIYFLEDYGTQFVVGDRVITDVLQTLKEDGLELASNRLELIKE